MGLVGSRRYDAFGQLTSPAQMYFRSANVGSTGHEDELERGLVNMGGRMYDPRLGRFQSADRVLDATSSEGLNRYS